MPAGYHDPVTPPAATIETARLILRPFNADDFDDLYAQFIHYQYVKGEWTDELIFAIIDREWKARFSRT